MRQNHGAPEQGGANVPTSEQIELTGSCLCGGVSYRLAQPLRVHYCHCGMCRRATGSAFAVLAWVKIGEIHWTGRVMPHERRSSPIARRSFCPECGTPMTLQYDKHPREIAVHAGTLDRPETFPPTSHYGVEGRLSWALCGDGLPEDETQEHW
jgi:hypothetical protein